MICYTDWGEYSGLGKGTDFVGAAVVGCLIMVMGWKTAVFQSDVRLTIPIGCQNGRIADLFSVYILAIGR